jgi:hypothetical protein
MDARDLVRRRRPLLTVGAAAVAGAAIIAGLAVSAGNAAPGASPTPTTVPTETAALTATATPATVVPKTEVPDPAATPPPRPAGPPLGDRVAADPVRVRTGDGDCLNIRQAPGTTFELVPSTCAPEGTLLWLYGPAQEADGEEWRYALGAGWVAVRYTAPASAPSLALPGNIVTLVQVGAYHEPNSEPGSRRGADVEVARVDAKSGSVLLRAVFPGYWAGLGSRNPELSRDGSYVAYGSGNDDGSVSIVVVGRVSDGTYVELPGFYPAGWSATGHLLLTASECDGTCTWTISVYDPASGEVRGLVEKAESTTALAWSGDGAAVLLAAENRLEKLSLDGKRTTIGTLEANLPLWNGVASPGGRYLLGGMGMDFVPIVDLRDGTVFKSQRPPQRELPGKCGGSFSQVNGWLGESRFFYHERSSSTGQDGLTIVDMASGTRTLLPLFNVQDVSAQANGLLSYATWAAIDTASFTVSFLLDPATGDSLPLFVGGGAAWSSE